jgi:hypothetical protein
MNEHVEVKLSSTGVLMNKDPRRSSNSASHPLAHSLRGLLKAPCGVLSSMIRAFPRDGHEGIEREADYTCKVVSFE